MESELTLFTFLLHIIYFKFLFTFIVIYNLYIFL